MDTPENRQESPSGIDSRTQSQSAPATQENSPNLLSRFLRKLLCEPSPLIDTIEDYKRDSLYRLPCLAGLVGLLIGMTLFYLIAHNLSSYPPLVQLALGLVPFQFFTFGLCFLALIPMMLRDGFRKSLDFISPPPSFKELAKTVFRLLVVLYPCVLILNWLSDFVCNTLSIPMPEQLISQVGKGADPIYWICAAFSAVLFAPITEEIMIRLVLNRAIRSIMPIWATLLSTFAFMLMHGTPQYWPSLFFVGLFLLRARRVMGLQCAILLHSTYNLIASLFIFIEKFFD